MWLLTFLKHHFYFEIVVPDHAHFQINFISTKITASVQFSLISKFS